MSKTLSVRISDELYENVLQRMKEDSSTLSDIVIQALERELLKGSVVSRLERAVERLEKLDKKPVEALSQIKRSSIVSNPKERHTTYDKPVKSSELDVGKKRIVELTKELGNVSNIDVRISEILISEGITTPTGKEFTRDLVADTKRKMKKRGIL